VIAGFALVLYLAALAIAFGWRSIVQWRRTGDTGLRLDTGRPGSLRWWAKLMFVVALLLAAGGPVAALAGLPPLTPLDQPWIRLAGTALAVAGAALTLAAQQQMGSSWRVGVDPGERTTLVTHGLFGIVRNPIFTAMAASVVGLAAMVPNAVSLTAAAVLIVSVQVQVRAVEEPYLVGVHGEAWTRYAARVGRFLPGVGAWRPRSG